MEWVCPPMTHWDPDDVKGHIEFRAAAARTTNLREQHYLTTRAARLATGLERR